MNDSDKLAPARGIFFACAICAPMWIAIIVWVSA